jgi:mediator of RNA polymerase II transcription subunit 5
VPHSLIPYELTLVLGQESSSAYPQGAWMDQSVSAIRTALQFAQAGKAPSIDLDRCLIVTSPSKFIQLLWSELSIAASMGQMEDCRRIATFVMVVMPRSPSIPRLLPIFLHVTLPSLIAAIDRQPPAEQAMSTELMVAMVSSVLTAALHFELAVRTVCDDKHNLGQSSMTMARRLAGDLRTRKHSPTSRVIAQRLTSSQAFVANFPVFMASDI